jgi:hypothetical protein
VKPSKRKRNRELRPKTLRPHPTQAVKAGETVCEHMKMPFECPQCRGLSKHELAPNTILWTRLENRTEPPFQYMRGGEMDTGIRWVKIVTRRAEDQDFDESITFIKRRVEAIALIENAIEAGFARAYQYKLVESAPPLRHQMTDARKEALRKLNERKRERRDK